MRSDLTDITLVVDRSGSMEGVRLEAERGVNAFVEEQAALPGEALVTLVQFDTEYEFLHRGVHASSLPPYVLKPCGMTALLDAFGRSLQETHHRLAQLNEDETPGLVVFVVMTDGLENASREFSRSAVRKLIRRHREQGWRFTFLGANQDAFAEAGSLGISSHSSMRFDESKSSEAWLSASSKLTRMRRQAQSGEVVQDEFTLEERESMS